MIRETRPCIHHRQLSSKSNSSFFKWFYINFGRWIFLHLSALPWTQTPYQPLGRPHVCAAALTWPCLPCPHHTRQFLPLHLFRGCSTACNMELRRDRPRQLISFSFFVPVSFEFGRAVWLRFHPSAYPPCPHPSFMAHLGGVMVGITLGVIILRNYEQRLQDQTLWWIFLSIYVIFVLFAIFWNIFAYSLLDLKLPPPPWKRGTESSKAEVICQLC